MSVGETIDRDNNSFLGSTSDKQPSSRQIENTDDDDDKMPTEVEITHDDHISGTTCGDY